MSPRTNVCKVQTVVQRSSIVSRTSYTKYSPRTNLCKVQTAVQRSKYSLTYIHVHSTVHVQAYVEYKLQYKDQDIVARTFIYKAQPTYKFM